MAGRDDGDGRMTVSAAQARELADLLRSRRARLLPADVGLPAGARRRTPGLRREEVAQLADISVTYYTYLEQGRDIRPSRQVLDALARALHLDAEESAYLRELVHRPAPASPGPPRAETLAPAVADLVSRLDPYPAYVTGCSWDVLAANRAARVLWTDWPARPPAERNMLWWTFTDPAARTILIDWDAEASALLARFRAAAARHPGDPAFGALLARLQEASPEVRQWWPRHEVAPLGSGRKRIHHDVLGDLDFQHVTLQVAEDPEQKLVTFTAGPRDQDRIARLLEAGR
jgi:transcriptional regulator with XRE-family HTH domain